MSNKDLIVDKEEIISSIEYDMVNLQNVREAVAKERQSSKRSHGTYTMVQVNSPCKVEVSDESRKICAKVLMR